MRKVFFLLACVSLLTLPIACKKQNQDTETSGTSSSTSIPDNSNSSTSQGSMMPAVTDTSSAVSLGTSEPANPGMPGMEDMTITNTPVGTSVPVGSSAPIGSSAPLELVPIGTSQP